MAPAFGRRAPRLRAEGYLLGLVAGLGRANGWTIAEFAGDRSPLGMQRLLNQAVWDAGAVRDRLVRYVAAELGDPAGILIADETGFLTSGRRSAGVRSASAPGRRGRSRTARSGCCWPTPSRRPEHGSWSTGSCVSRDRGRLAGTGADVAFAAKPQLVRAMVERAAALGLPFAWFTADEAYGDNGKLRQWLEKSAIADVVAVACDTAVPAGVGKTIRADRLAAKAPGNGWQRLSCGPGSKGERLYDWAIAPAGRGRPDHCLGRAPAWAGRAYGSTVASPAR